jgi:sulfur-oxidizing protein SoxY
MQGTLTRRRFGQAVMALAAIAALPLRALAARNDTAFKATATDVVLKELFGDKPMNQTDAFEFKVPDIAEDGSIVPVTVSTDMQGVKSITLIVDANPNPLSARFNFMPGACRNSRLVSRWARAPMCAPSSRPMTRSTCRPKTSKSPLAAAAVELGINNSRAETQRAALAR